MANYEEKPNTLFFMEANKSKDSHPDFTGHFIDANGNKMSLAIWENTSASGKIYYKGMVSEFKQKDDKPKKAKPKKEHADSFQDFDVFGNEGKQDDNDDLPF